MKKIACILSLLTFVVMPALAQHVERIAEQSARISAQVQRNVARTVLHPYIPPTTTLVTDPVKITALEQSLNYKLRPIDQVRHSIVPSATTVLGSEKIDFLTPQEIYINSWNKQYREKYYTTKQRDKLKNLLASDYGSIQANRPNPSDLEDRVYQYVKDGTDFYLVPMYRSLLRDETKITPTVTPYVTGAAFSEHEPRLEAHQLGAVSSDMLQMITASGKLLYFLPEDPYLKAVHSFYVGVYQVFNPILGSLVGGVKLDRPDGRTFNWHEFFLFDSNHADYTIYGPESWSEQAEEEMGSLRYLADKAASQSADLLKNLPPDLHIAVLNDDEKPLANFRRWAQEGRLGAQAKVSTFEDGEDLIKSIESGAHYNLIITDIHVPNGGRAMMPTLRTLTPNTTVFAMSKEPRQKVGAIHLFDIGMDGYIPYTTFLNDEHVGYWEFLRALTNYMNIRSPNWIR